MNNFHHDTEISTNFIISYPYQTHMHYTTPVPFNCNMSYIQVRYSWNFQQELCYLVNFFPFHEKIGRLRFLANFAKSTFKHFSQKTKNKSPSVWTPCTTSTSSSWKWRTINLANAKEKCLKIPWVCTYISIINFYVFPQYMQKTALKFMNSFPYPEGFLQKKNQDSPQTIWLISQTRSTHSSLKYASRSSHSYNFNPSFPHSKKIPILQPPIELWGFCNNKFSSPISVERKKPMSSISHKVHSSSILSHPPSPRDEESYQKVKIDQVKGAKSHTNKSSLQERREYLGNPS